MDLYTYYISFFFFFVGDKKKTSSHTLNINWFDYCLDELKTRSSYKYGTNFNCDHSRAIAALTKTSNQLFWIICVKQNEKMVRIKGFTFETKKKKKKNVILIMK